MHLHVLLTVQMARRHAIKAKEYEEQLNRTLRERQKVFEEAFREQMHNYQRTGKLDGLFLCVILCQVGNFLGLYITLHSNVF